MCAVIVAGITEAVNTFEVRRVLYDEKTTFGVPPSPILTGGTSVGLRPPGKAFAQHAIESDAPSGLRPTRSAMRAGYFVLSEGST